MNLVIMVRFTASDLYALYKPTRPHWNVRAMNLINDYITGIWMLYCSCAATIMMVYNLCNCGKDTHFVCFVVSLQEDGSCTIALSF